MSLLMLLKRAQNNDEDAMMEIIERFEPKIRKSLRSTDSSVRDDIRQEMSLKIIEYILKYNFDKTLECFDFVKRVSQK
ncbi:helix-turn-helix domain-containing protein [Brevibacillus sp. HB1.2]|nr:helix-turn-helix domain-containing protein [Brevibacillus sp. HB1.2]